jgi:hypothetical protein
MFQRRQNDRARDLRFTGAGGWWEVRFGRTGGCQESRGVWQVWSVMQDVEEADLLALQSWALFIHEDIRASRHSLVSEEGLGTERTCLS